LKGLHNRRVTSPAQYSALFTEWAAKHAEPIYRDMLEALLKAGW
jgi:hypothetical protein